MKIWFKKSREIGTKYADTEIIQDENNIRISASEIILESDTQIPDLWEVSDA